MAARQAIHTDSAPVRPGYSQAIVAGNLVFVAGTTGMDMETGTWPEGIEAQAERALKNLQAVLAEAGCTYDDVVKTTTFLTPAASYAGVEEAYARDFQPPRPARSAPVVALPVPEALISIEAVALKPTP